MRNEPTKPPFMSNFTKIFIVVAFVFVVGFIAMANSVSDDKPAKVDTPSTGTLTKEDRAWLERESRHRREYGIGATENDR